MDASDDSEGLWATVRLQRPSARHGELGSVVIIEICFQEPERDATRSGLRFEASAEHNLLKPLRKTTRGGIREVRQGERRAVPIRVCWEVGRGLILMPGQMGSPGPLFYFYFLFFFCFLISFISFAYIIQTRSIQFLKFCKIQHNVLTH
jgi:hypothetical protein